MVVRKKKKVRKFRGRRSHGYGRHKRHRGKGSRGGKGFAGMHKQKWTYTVKYEKEHFGKRGFVRPAKVVRKIRAITLKELDQMVEKLLKQKLAEREDDKIKTNLTKIGYDKILGSGRITRPLIVEAKFFSKLAIKKLEEAGGKAVKI